MPVSFCSGEDAELQPGRMLELPELPRQEFRPPIMPEKEVLLGYTICERRFDNRQLQSTKKIFPQSVGSNDCS